MRMISNTITFTMMHYIFSGIKKRIYIAFIIDWSYFEKEFAPLYFAKGKHAVPIRLMVATAWNLMKMMRKLKHLFADFLMTILNYLYQPMLQVAYQR